MTDGRARSLPSWGTRPIAPPTLVLGPINTRVDVHGYLYDRSDAVIDAVAHDNITLLFDV